MNRRLFFLLPDRQHAASAIDELKSMHIHHDDIHVYGTSENDIATFHTAGRKVMLEVSGKSERFAWNANLVLFFIALTVFVFLLLSGLAAWSAVPIVIMIATVWAGNFFTNRIPNVHLDEFRDALHHGEILVMADVPRKRLSEIERAVRSHHPEAATGGVGWTLNPLHH